MQQAQKASRAIALKLARQVATRRSSRIVARVDATALTPKRRAELRQEIEQLKQERDAFRSRARELRLAPRELLTAAQFVADVDAQEPSLSQLKAAVARATERDVCLETDRLCQRLITEKASLSHRRRYTISECLSTPLPHYLQLASGDTWQEVCDELRKEIESKQRRKCR